MEPAVLFELINELIVSMAKLLWPIVVLIAVIIFRKDIRSLLNRVRKGKLFGQEIELDPIDKFRKSVEEIKEEVSKTRMDMTKIQKVAKESDKDIKGVLEAAEVNPELGIIKLSSIIEREIRILAGSRGQWMPKSNMMSVVGTLMQEGFISSNSAESLKLFWQLRNQIVHGYEPRPPHEVLKVLDIGLELLKAIRSKSYEINIVYHPGVDLFSDENCKNRLEGVKGVILETISADRKSIFKRIFPTTDPAYYQKEQMVSWEWSFSNKWGQTWYIDPDTDEKKKAWDNAAEFAGRHLEDK